MQDGSVTVERRKRGPDVWSFRWHESGPDGRRVHRRIVLGSADDLKSLSCARKMVVGLRREINVTDVRIRKESITLADLTRHYQQRELIDRNPRISCSTKKIYAGYLKEVGRTSMGLVRTVGHSSCRSRVVAENSCPSSGMTLQDTERDESALQSWPSLRPLRTQPD
jgi:hypothetical protein